MRAKTEPLSSDRPLLLIDATSGALTERSYVLTVDSGPDAGKRLIISSTVVIGTHEDAQLVLADATVSRFHVELAPRADGLRIRDLQSTNGVLVGGLKVHEAVLTGEAVIKLGKSTLSVVAADHPVETPPALASFGGIGSRSPRMHQLFGVLLRVAPTDSTVLLQGETGVGKDALAQAIHAASARRARPLVVVDCSASSASLIESELFGHRKGAFSGAISDRTGAFVAADRGTLFLDEIGELPLELQPKLLRALEAGTVKPLGQDGHQRVDVRILAATHRDLRREVAEGRFRADLYYRLAVVPVVIPPLRERPEDLTFLFEHFARSHGREPLVLDEASRARLAAHAWPGNARELRNLVERSFASGAILAPEDPGEAGLPRPSTGAELTAPFKEAKERLVGEFTRAYLEALSERCGGNLSRMAREAGIARHYLRELLARHQLKVKE